MRRWSCITTVIILTLIGLSMAGPVGGVEPGPLGPFRPAGSLTEGRWGPTATLLEDGRVLVIGGTTTPRIGGHRSVVAQAELWDPATETFTAAGRLGREGHTATLLPDGRVLIVGGDQPRRSLASAWTWDPTTVTFERTGSLEEARRSHTATLLPDGRVLVVGGWVEDEAGIRSAEIWDSATGSFAPTGALIEGRSDHTATLLDDGRVLVLGGDSSDGVAGNELWDPVTGEFSRAGPVGTPLGGHTATLMPDGRVLVVGGYGGSDDDDTTAVFWDPADGSFTPAGTPLCARYAHTGTLLPDGRVLVVGGLVPRSSGASLASAELWNPDTGTFEFAGSLAEARGGHAATLLSDARVLIVGGGRIGVQEAIDVMSVQAELWEGVPRTTVPGTSSVPACIAHLEAPPGL